MVRGSVGVGRRAALKTEEMKEALGSPGPFDLGACLTPRNEGTLAAGKPTALGSRAEGGPGRCQVGGRAEVGR